MRRAARGAATDATSESTSLAGGSAVGAGTSNQNVEPSPSMLEKPTSPPIMVARLRVMARPRPEPPNCRAVEPSAWWKRWNRWGWADSAMPTPVSSISKRSRR